MSHAYWYATRGTGLVALVLLTLVVALGVAGSLRLRSDRWPRFLVVGLHRNLTLLTLVFLAGHIVTTLLDSYTPVTLRDAFVPFLASYRPLWLGLGAIAFDLLLALTATSLLRARVGYRTWRALHWLAYAAWPVALTHALGTGSDARFGWLQTLAAACVLLVLAALARRLHTAAAPPGRRILAGAGALVVLVFGVTWYRTGPGAHGWAARAGTPTKLLASAQPRVRAAAAAAPVPTTQPASDVPSPPFSAHLSGRLSTTVEPASGLVRVDIRAHTSGAVDGLLWIRLQGEPVEGGGVSMNASGAAFGTPTAPDSYVGKITALQGTQMALALHNGGGKRIELDVALSIDQATHRVSGTVQAVPGGGESQ